MAALKQRLFQPVKTPAGRHSIGGMLPVVAVVGMIVNRKAGATDELELSTGKAGYFLCTPTVADLAALKALVDANELRPDKAGFEYPVVAGSVVQAEDYEEIWVEGPGLLNASMDVTVVAGQQVTSNAGKFTKLTDSKAQECIAKVVLNEQGAVDPANRRFLLQVMRSAKVIP